MSKGSRDRTADYERYSKNWGRAFPPKVAVTFCEKCKVLEEACICGKKSEQEKAMGLERVPAYACHCTGCVFEDDYTCNHFWGKNCEEDEDLYIWVEEKAK